MSNRTLSIDARLYDYICAVAVDESALLRDLRQETRSVELSNMQIAPDQGQFMQFLVTLIGARNAIEIGTYTGYSSICIASALENSGQLICCDVSAEWTALARKYWAKAGLDTKIKLVLQPAQLTLQHLLDEGRAADFDFIFIDADKQNYPVYYELALQLLKKGGLMAIDNTLWSGSVADPENNEPATRAIRRFNKMVQADQRVKKSMLTIGDGLTLVIKDID